ncbi:unnamed protein product [Macrosiphum euphorbiae]|uniref:Uncharacterized protein n=1 Tax=Macrosiphum euphorbiae TaxID=13131 RepID=A0AAV0XNM1_9HEMI|nr:unnamed protein product [Macrosiphum euphorbiae]
MDSLKQTLVTQTSVQFVSVGDLTIDRPYPVLKMVNQDTQYGQTVISTLEGDAGNRLEGIILQYGLFKADVGHTNKRSICVHGRSHDRQAIPSIEDGQPGHTDEEILEFNGRVDKNLKLVYKGRRGRAFNITFV